LCCGDDRDVEPGARSAEGFGSSFEAGEAAGETAEAIEDVVDRT
jgi:hypothetical protein